MEDGPEDGRDAPDQPPDDDGPGEEARDMAGDPDALDDLEIWLCAAALLDLFRPSALLREATDGLFVCTLDSAGFDTYTDFDTVPCCSTPAEILFSFPKDSRGTPSPAESLRKTKESDDSLSFDTARGLVLTTTKLERPATGAAAGGLMQFSHLTGLLPLSASAWFCRIPWFCNPFHSPPGRQPQPLPPQ